MENVMKLALILSISDRLTSPLGRAVQALQRVQNDANKAGAALQKMGQKMKQSGAGMMQTAKSGILGVVGMGASLAFPVKAAMEFESVMADVNKVAAFSKTEFATASDGLLNLSKRLPMAASGLGEIMASAAQSGIAKQELLRFTEDAAKMGVAFGISAGDAGSAMTGMRNIFRLSQDGVIALGDAVNHLANKMDATAPNILTFLNRAGSVGDTFKMSGQQVSAFGAALIAMKTPPEIASRAFSGMLMQLSVGGKATKDQRAAFKQIGMSAEGMAAMMKRDATGALVTFLEAVKKSSDPMGVLRSLVGQGFADDIVKLVGGVDKLKGALGLVGDKSSYAGSMLREYETRSKTTENSVQLLQNNVKAAAITIGNIFLPSVNETVLSITSLVDRFGAWAKEHPRLISFLGKLATGVVALKAAGLGFKFVGGGFLSLGGSVMSGSGKLLSYLGNVRTGFKLFRQEGAGLFGSVLKGAWYGANWTSRLDKPMGWAKGLFSRNKDKAALGKMLAPSLAETGKATFSNAGGLWSGVWSGLKKGWRGTKDFGGEALTKAGGALKTLRSGLVDGAAAGKKFVVGFATSSWAGLKNFGGWLLSTAVPAVWSFTTALLANPMTWVVVGAVALGAAIYLLWKNWDKVTKTVSRWWGNIKRFMSPMVDWFRALPDRIWEGIVAVYDAITDPFRRAINKITEWWEGFKSWFTGSPVKSSVNVTTNVSGAGVQGMPQSVPTGPASLYSIPRHAAGGLVSRPIVSWIGEAGAEMVVPLTNRTRGRAFWLWAGQLLGMLPRGLSSFAPELSSALAGIDGLKAPSLDVHMSSRSPERRQGSTRRREKERRPFIIGGPLTINVGGADDPKRFVEVMASELQKLVDARGAVEIRSMATS